MRLNSLRNLGIELIALRPTSLDEIQKHLVKCDEIIEVGIDIVMPRIGGYNANPYDKELDMNELPRVTEIKALWRWWLRTVYSACNCGEKNYKDLDNDVGMILGSVSMSSKLALALTVVTNMKKVVVEQRNLKNYERVPRLKLLTHKKSEEEKKEILYIPERVQAIISVYRNRGNIEEKELKVTIATFMLSLLLGGLGSISSRGFGSIIIRHVNINERYGEQLKEIVRYITNILNSRSSKELEERINEFVSYVINLVCEGKMCRADKLPEVPTLMPEKYFKLKAIEPNCSNVLDIIVAIGNACLKASWKRLLNMEISGDKLHTWILGLPRGIKKTPKRAKGTGYVFGYALDEEGKNLGRRPSAIRLKYFENNVGKRFIIIYGFLSRDWPLENLYYLSPSTLSRKRREDVASNKVEDMEVLTPDKNKRPCDLDNVFNVAFDFVIQYLSREACKESRDVSRGRSP
ncbi:MAG: type III-B CRISPR module RAMP protein Cmr1 [Ignisphaera sp.]